MIKLSYRFLLCALLAACQQNTVASEDAVLEPSQVQKVVWQNAQVKKFDFEGGFYGLITADGQKLLPMNLSNEFQKDGLMVKIQGVRLEGMMTIQQWGEPYKITAIAKK